MKKEYTTPSIGVWQMTAFSPLAVSEPFAGEWGSEGGEAGAKASLFDVAEEEVIEDDNTDDWDPEGNPLKLNKHQRKWYQDF